MKARLLILPSTSQTLAWMRLCDNVFIYYPHHLNVIEIPTGMCRYECLVL